MVQENQKLYRAIDRARDRSRDPLPLGLGVFAESNWGGGRVEVACDVPPLSKDDQF
jgi:hypothetical protein